MRVPWNTQAPLTRWGSRSTAAQPAQPRSACVGTTRSGTRALSA
jgi:hypothetical protein